jgi:FkbM family methyltransferase
LKWKWLPNYIATFGLARGLRTFANIHLKPRPADSLFAVHIAGRVFWLRNTASDISIFSQIWIKKEYDVKRWPELWQRLQTAHRLIIESGRKPLIIDAGANIGLASLWFTMIFPESHIYAVEPDEGNFALLRKNIADYPNITPIAGAVWDRPVRMRIANPSAGAGAYRVTEGNGGVRAYTIPELIKASGGELFIVKIDIEGGEDALFRSNTEWLAAAHLTVLEPHDWLYPTQGTSRNFLRRICETKVDFVFQGENVFCFKYD